MMRFSWRIQIWYILALIAMLVERNAANTLLLSYRRGGSSEGSTTGRSPTIVALLRRPFSSWCIRHGRTIPYDTFRETLGRYLSVNASRVSVDKICNDDASFCLSEQARCGENSSYLPVASEVGKVISEDGNWDPLTMWVTFTLPESVYTKFCSWVVERPVQVHAASIELVEISPSNGNATACSGEVAAKCPWGFTCSMRVEVNMRPPICRAEVGDLANSNVLPVYIFIAFITIFATIFILVRHAHSAQVRENKRGQLREYDESLLRPTDSASFLEANLHQYHAGSTTSEQPGEEHQPIPHPDRIQVLLDQLDMVLFRYNLRRRDDERDEMTEGTTPRQAASTTTSEDTTRATVGAFIARNVH
uniref:Uncharacterized protein n=1 Tax=Guillardia theta TaxID=55529 RepID=A0A7S4KHR2_GUITH|mmetsp:Transcript_24627/g.80716  ORF Transcript_24627/g.80716 Transcript_24627/m.80716 type:complete len:363 (+) Transcript_24627:223-1311(+)